MEMNKFYNDFYTKFGRTVHDIREQQEQDIVEYAENGLTEDDIVILTDMDRRRIREIIRNMGERALFNLKVVNLLLMKSQHELC